MKGIKLTLVLSIAALALLGLSRMTFAFHDGGVAECAGCHTMHNSDNNAAVVQGSGTATYLLKYTKPSDTCIACHSHQFSTDGSKFRSGGDFFWVSKTYTVLVPGHTGALDNVTIDGDKRGHNIISDTKTVIADKQLATAPGGTYSSSKLGCQSCHDPHGKGGHPVLLWGAGATAKTNSSYNFANDVPTFVNAGRKNNVSDTLHSAYGEGMSGWCANCHAGMYNVAGSTKHKVDIEIGGLESNYNSYLLNGATGINSTNSYVELVPFETGSDNVLTLSTGSTAGPDGTSRVMCLTCHRSHASPFKGIGRWDFGTTLMEESVPGPIVSAAAGVPLTAAQTTYGRPAWNTTQRSLCNKCHAKDQ